MPALCPTGKPVTEAGGPRLRQSPQRPGTRGRNKRCPLCWSPRAEGARVGAGLPPAGHLSVGVSTPALCLHLRADHLCRAETLPGPAVLLRPGLSGLMGRPSLDSVLVRVPRVRRGNSQLEPHVGSGVAAWQGELGTRRGGAEQTRVRVPGEVLACGLPWVCVFRALWECRRVHLCAPHLHCACAHACRDRAPPAGQVHTWELCPSAPCLELPDPGHDCVGELRPCAGVLSTCV